MLGIHDAMIKYSATRLLFKRAVIEPLSMDEFFQIVTPQGTFQFTRRQFEAEFPNVVKTKSYRIKGAYHYASTPQRALKYLIPGTACRLPGISSQGKYTAPSYVRETVDQALYASWLHKKAVAHVVRDRKRWKAEIRVADYKQAIHQAVLNGNGFDPYTGEKLDWHLIGKFDNESAKGAGSAYKKKFRLLPTVDHLDHRHTNKPRFQICSWEVNDAKSDLTHDEFIRLCKQITDFDTGMRNKP